MEVIVWPIIANLDLQKIGFKKVATSVTIILTSGLCYQTFAARVCSKEIFFPFLESVPTIILDTLTRYSLLLFVLSVSV